MPCLTRLALGLAVLLASAHAWALTESEFVQKGKRVVAIARAVGLTAAEKIFAAPGSGFVALEGPGLHVWATDANGIVIFDLSGQTTPGTDLSHWANDDGVILMESIGKVVAHAQGGLLARFKGIPHPKTNRLGAADFYCGRVAQGAIVCATYTPDAH
jgi:hypothetical protein